MSKNGERIVLGVVTLIGAIVMIGFAAVGAVEFSKRVIGGVIGDALGIICIFSIGFAADVFLVLIFFAFFAKHTV